MEVTTLTPIFYTLSPFCSKTSSFFLDSIHNTRALTQNNQSKQKNKHCSWMYFSPEWIQVFFYPQTNDLLCCPQKVTTLTKSIPFTSFSVQEHGKKAQGTLLTSHTKWVIFSCLLCGAGQSCGLLSFQENVMLQLNCYLPTGVLANLSTERLCRLCLLTVVR